MNFFVNGWKQPKTTAAGLLIAVASVAGVLAQQGISLGRVGTGTVVSLVSALATAMLGLLAKDPDAANQRAEGSASQLKQASRNNSKLGVWVLIALLVPLPWMEGCSAKSVAQNIVNWTPALESAVATVDSTAALLTPGDAPIFAAATNGFDAASNLLATQARAYLATPTAGTLQELQTQVVTFQQQVGAALFKVAQITNPASEAHALAAIQDVATIVNSMLSLVASISNRTAVQKMSAETGIKLTMMRSYLDGNRAAELVAAHYGEPMTVARAQVAQAEHREMQAGF